MRQCSAFLRIYEKGLIAAPTFFFAGVAQAMLKLGEPSSFLHIKPILGSFEVSGVVSLDDVFCHFALDARVSRRMSISGQCVRAYSYSSPIPLVGSSHRTVYTSC